MLRKKIIFSCIFALLFLLILTPVKALENLGAFTIDSYDVIINLDNDGKMLVEEKIVVDFSEKRHGIYREIPYKYKDDKGFKHNLRMKFFSVEDEQGKNWQFEKSRSGENYVLKIGHPDYFVSGRQVYNIQYEVERAVRFFDDHSEIYWNPIGTGWPTTIGSAVSIVSLPREISLTEEDLTCFVGSLGSQSQDCSARITSSTSLYFSSNDPLDPYEGMTIAVKFPLGYIPPPSFLEKVKYFLLDNFGFLLPILIFVLMYGVWKKRGKDIKLDKASLVQYEPPDKLTPGETGYLLKEKYKSKFVAADIVNLAVKGYLKIKEEKRVGLAEARIVKTVLIIAVLAFLGAALFMLLTFPDIGFGFFLLFLSWAIIIIILKFIFQKKFGNFEHVLIKTKDWEDGKLTGHEKSLMKGLFKDSPKEGVRISNLKTFYKDVSESREKLKNRIKDLDYFEKSIYNNKILYFVLAFIFLFLGIILSAVFARLDFFGGAVASALIIGTFGFYMPKRTQKGAEALWRAQGFSDYINTAEKYRVKFEEKENLFFEILPYAMIFGLADKWAKAFRDIINKSPDWYETKDPSHFSPAILAASLGSFSSQASAVSHAPSSSSSSSGFSGGFSGGGFGGGGGGSW